MPSSADMHMLNTDPNPSRLYITYKLYSKLAARGLEGSPAFAAVGYFTNGLAHLSLLAYVNPATNHHPNKPRTPVLHVYAERLTRAHVL